MTYSPARRRLLLAAGLLPLLPAARAAGQRVVVVGGGWGGLTAAAELRRVAPELEVVLVDRQSAFASFALSNRWLVDVGAGELVRHDYAAIAAARGYRFVQAEAQAIEAAAQRLQTTAGPLAYDWLVLAPGIRENFAAWGITDPAAVDALKSRFSGALLHPGELPALKARLARFSGGDLVMSIPPLPYRCPPAPYERALLIAWWLKTRKIPGKLVIVDPNPIMPAFRNALLDRYREQVSYLDHAHIRQVDWEKKTLATDVDDIPFAEAILCPPQQAAGLLWSAGLIRTDANDGRPDGWGAQGALDLRSAGDRRIFIVGDAAGVVSPLFGAYPKTGHLACRLGVIVARRIAAEAAGREAAPLLPESVCHLTASLDPEETIRIETDYRQRGDGLLLQNVRQTREANPAGEDAAWAAARYREFLLPAG